MSKKASNAALALVSSCAFKGAHAHAAIVAAIKAAGGTAQKAVRDAFVHGWTAGVLNAGAVALSPAMLDAAKAKASKGTALFAAQAAARKQWSRMLAKAGAKSADKRGGARAPRASTENTPKVAAAPAKPETAPRVKEPAPALDWIALRAAALLTFANKNGDAVPPAVGAAIKALDKAIASAKAK